MSPSRPSGRQDFEIAIICALPLEYNAAALIFDEFWDEEGDVYGRAPGDPNSYTTGRVGDYNVVLALLPQMGKRSAASAAASMRSSFENLRLTLLVGICGGVPYNGETEVLLGDVIVSQTVVQYDFGRKYPDRFVRKDTVLDNFGQANKVIKALLAKLQTDRALDRLQQQTIRFLHEIQEEVAKTKRRGKYDYPGRDQDILYKADYRHKHHRRGSRRSLSCVCKDCRQDSDPTCAEAPEFSCDKLGCSERYSVERKRLGPPKPDRRDNPPDSIVHIGRVASGDMVIKSASDRDKIAEQEGVIAFEMEGAGIWDELPCIVLKSVCDYADSHKNKIWQNFAAATAAATSKAILEFYTQSSQTQKQSTVKKGYWMVPFGRNEGFVGRDDILSDLVERIPPTKNTHNCQKTVVEGLGGIGKTQVALEAVYRVSEKYPECSIFWVPALDANTFDNAYGNIGRLLRLPGIDKEKANIRKMVKAALSKQDLGPWLLVIDNADDIELLFGPNGIHQWLPFSVNGSILFTTRNHGVSVKLDIHRNGIFPVQRMSLSEAMEMLKFGLSKRQVQDISSTTALLDFLISLPLAIKQASAYMAKTGITTTQYLKYCNSNDNRLANLLSTNFDDCGRYDSKENPITVTWLISFSDISRDNPVAGKYLQYASFFREKNIPVSLLQSTEDELEINEALGILRAYAFISNTTTDGSFEMHRLVRLAMRNWLDENGMMRSVHTNVMEHLLKRLPEGGYKNKILWEAYLPHINAILEFAESDNEITRARLLSRTGCAFTSFGQDQRSLQFHQQAFELRKKVFGETDPKTLISMADFGRGLFNLKRYTEAEPIQRREHQLRSIVLGEEHPGTLKCLNRFAKTLVSTNKSSEAEQVHRQLLEVRTKTLGEEHYDTVHSMYRVGCCMHRLGRLEEAENQQRRVLELTTKLFGEENTLTLAIMRSLGLILHTIGKMKEAERLHREVVLVSTRNLGQGHHRTLQRMQSLAQTLEKSERLDEAKQIYQETLALRTMVHGEDHPSTRKTNNRLRRVHDKIRDSEKALESENEYTDTGSES